MTKSEKTKEREEARLRRVLELRESVTPYGMPYRAIAGIITSEAEKKGWGRCSASQICRWRNDPTIKIDGLAFRVCFEAIQDVLDEESEIEKRERTDKALSDGTDAKAIRNWLNAREHYNKHSSIQRHHHTMGGDPETVRFVVPQSDEFKPPEE